LEWFCVIGRQNIHRESRTSENKMQIAGVGIWGEDQNFDDKGEEIGMSFSIKLAAAVLRMNS